MLVCTVQYYWPPCCHEDRVLFPVSKKSFVCLFDVQSPVHRGIKLGHYAGGGQGSYGCCKGYLISFGRPGQGGEENRAVDEMNAMLYRLLKSHHLGSKCCLSTLLWSLAAWILFLQVYNSLFPSSIQLPEPRSPWGKASLDGHNDPAGVHQRMPRRTRIASVGKRQSVPNVAGRGKAKVGRYAFDASFKNTNKSIDKAEEEANELAALQKLALLFPSRKLAVDPTKTSRSEQGFFYPGREWRDTEGKTIQAHGGGILYVAETRTYYWYGEDKGGPTYQVGKHGAARVSPPFDDQPAPAPSSAVSVSVVHGLLQAREIYQASALDLLTLIVCKRVMIRAFYSE